MDRDERNEILLVGNPNVGKSVIFAHLTGRYAVVSNYPGTTVEVSTGRARFDRAIEVIDTPGVNSLFPKSEDERVTRDILLQYREAVVVQIADAKNLFRTLLLTAQLAEMGCRMLLVLNMMDEARQRGIHIDTAELSSALGIPVIETVAVEKRGLPRLAQLLGGGAARVPHLEVTYPTPVRRPLAETERTLSTPGGYSRFEALTVLSGEPGFAETSREPTQEGFDDLTRMIGEHEARLPNPLSYYIAEGIQETAGAIARRVSIGAGEAATAASRLKRLVPAGAFVLAMLLLYLLAGPDRLASAGLHPTLLVLLVGMLGISITGAERINRLTLHPLFGTLILLVVIYLVYMLVGIFAAGTLVDLLEEGLFGGLVIPALAHVLPEGWLYDFLIGEYGLVSMGLNYSISIVFPIVTVFFFVFGILEDTGYFPRLTVLTNRAFRVVGVNGKATLPIVLGFGCVTMSVLASRILETRRERLIVVALLALAIPCSAQMGVILALMSAISTGAVVLIACIVVSLFVLVGLLLSRLIPGETSDFLIELPPLRAPRPGNIMLKTGTRARWFLTEALPFFIVATLILFVLDRTGGLRFVESLVEPVVSRFLGLPVETAAIFIIGFFRRDYGAAGLYKLWEGGQLEGNQVVVALVVMSLFLPCLATFIVMIKELGHRHAIAILVFVLAVSVLVGGLLNFAIDLLGVRF